MHNSTFPLKHIAPYQFTYLLQKLERYLTKRLLRRISRKYELTDLPNASQIVDCCDYLEKHNG